MTNRESQRAPIRFECPTCQFAYECQNSAGECVTCGCRRDLRANAQLAMLRDDGRVNKAQAE